MARAGINKAVVSAARQAVLARGDNPTIDAVRIEMGNTGSKTTIHRYLKELEARSPAPATHARGMSEELSSLVKRLAERLEEEGEVRVAQAREQFDETLAQAQGALSTTEQQLAQLQQAHGIQTQALQAQTRELLACQTLLQSEQTRSARLDQAADDLQVRLKDKDEHIASLEEKHQHARDALEHYRQSIKEQREQELRRHEAQLQAQQLEVRQLQQTLQVKQQEATSLNRDNERLLVEHRQAFAAQQSLQAELMQQAERLNVAGQALARVEGGHQEVLRQLADSRTRLDQALTLEHSHRREIAGLSSQLGQLQNEHDSARHALAQALQALEEESAGPRPA